MYKKNVGLMRTVLILACLTMSVSWVFAKETISIKGSDTLVILGQRWAEVYMKKNPGVQVQVTGGGTGTGIAALINGTTDICEASRPMKDKEKADLKLKRKSVANEIPVALDGISLFVHAKNPIKSLTLAQIRDIYTGEITNWNQLGGPNAKIVLYGRENNSGTYAYFKEHVLQDDDFVPQTQTLPGTAAIINAVARDPKGIGYGGIAYAKGVRAVSVSKDAKSPAYAPNEANVESGIYPISRYLFWYTAGTPKPSIQKLVNWVQTSEGQGIVKNVGYYPLPKKLHKKSK